MYCLSMALIPPPLHSPSPLRHETRQLFSKTSAQGNKFLPSMVVNFRPFKNPRFKCSSSTTTFNESSTSSYPLMEMRGHLFILFQEIGFQDKETQRLIDRNPHLLLLLVPLESIRNRISSLNSVGIHGFALCRLITKRAEVLTSEEIEPLLCFLDKDLEGEVKPHKLCRLLSITEPRLFVGFVEKVRLLLDHGVPQDKLAHVLNNVNLNRVFCNQSAKEIESTIAFLSRLGGFELIVKGPTLLNKDLEGQLIPRVNLLVRELGVEDESVIGAVVRKVPAILNYSVEHLQGHIEFLRSFAGLSNTEIFRIVTIYPMVFSVSRERQLQPRIEFLMQCGLNSNDIFRFLTKAPLFLSLSYKENLSKKLVFLLKIGYKSRTKGLAVAMGAVCRTSCENVQNMVGVFLSYGFSCEEIYVMSMKRPQVLQYNPESLRKKMEYLIEEMGREVGEVLAFPAFLGYKLDNRIKHRYEMKKKVIEEGMSINKLLSVSNERFSEQKILDEVENQTHAVQVVARETHVSLPCK